MGQGYLSLVVWSPSCGWDDLAQLKEGGLVAIDFVNTIEHNFKARYGRINPQAHAPTLENRKITIWRTVDLVRELWRWDAHRAFEIPQRPSPCLSAHFIRTHLKTPLDRTSCGPITQRVCGHCLPGTPNRPYASRYLDGARSEGSSRYTFIDVTVPSLQST